MELDIILQVIADEPELEDEMPEAMWKFISESKENAVIAMRHIVRLTKEGIAQRMMGAK